jgi:hypothetical protein
LRDARVVSYHSLLVPIREAKGASPMKLAVTHPQPFRPTIVGGARRVGRASRVLRQGDRRCAGVTG